jgi:CRISPR-associated protein Csx10
MAAGSCVVFKVTNGSVVLDALQKVEAAGIGERRGEGYGQVRFNPPLLMQEINEWEAAAKPDEAKPATGNAEELSGEERKFAELIEETAWREELKVAVLKIAAEPKYRKAIFGFDSEIREPPMSQVGGLRSAISRLQQPADRTIAIGWLKHLKATPNRHDRWAKGKEAAKKKLNKIINLLEPLSRREKPEDEPQNVWEWLQDGFNDPPTLVRSREELQQKFWAEAVRALFYACARAHKRRLEKEGSN